MKAIQVLFDENLLSELDADPKVKKMGRSAILRHAAAEYLIRQKRAGIALQYRRTYGKSSGLGPEFDGWETEGRWPEE